MKNEINDKMSGTINQAVDNVADRLYQAKDKIKKMTKA